MPLKDIRDGNSLTFKRKFEDITNGY